MKHCDKKSIKSIIPKKIVEKYTTYTYIKYHLIFVS